MLLCNFSRHLLLEEASQFGIFSEGFPGIEILECAELRVAVLPVQRIGAFIVPLP